MFSALLMLAVASSTPAEAAGWCSSTDWQDLVDYAPSDYLYGGDRAAGVGGKGVIDFTTDTLYFDIYNNSTYVGTADVDAVTGAVTLTGGITRFEAVSFGYSCSIPASLRYLIQVEASGVSFWAYAVP